MSVSLSKKEKGIVAIGGHVGCGHSHSLNDQVQDDSPGLSVVLSLFKEATGISLKVKEITFKDNDVTVTLENGGTGTGTSRRRMTQQEKVLAQKLIGQEVINTHTLVLDAFGRIYGQGVLETPVAVQTALANAALNSFTLNFPDSFITVTEDFENNCGNIVGTVLDIDGISVSVLGTVNATSGGIGPNEDLEGNSALYGKKSIIEKLGMDKLPTLIVEAMIYSGFSKGLTENTYFVRGDEEDDNPFVVDAVVAAYKKLGLPHKFLPGGGMKRTKDALRNNTKKVGERVISLGEQLRAAETSQEKVTTIAELALVVSQDCGGISFMTNELHEEIGGAGMLRRTSAVINLVVTDKYAEENPIPYLTDKELAEYVNISKETVKALAEKAKEATSFIG